MVANRLSSRAARGFTLLEMMVTVAIIGMTLTVIFTGNAEGRLVQSRLGASAHRLRGVVELLRTQALFRQREIVLTLDFEERGFSAHYPVELDENGQVIGPGETLVEEFERLREGIAFEKLVLPDGQLREDGNVELRISPMGRLPDVDIVIFNPEYPDTEVHTLQLFGMQDRVLHLEGRIYRDSLVDADFR